MGPEQGAGDDHLLHFGGFDAGLAGAGAAWAAAMVGALRIAMESPGAMSAVELTSAAARLRLDFIFI